MRAALRSSLTATALIAAALMATDAERGAAQEAAPTSSDGLLAADYPLQPGDQIRLAFEREPELGGEYIVDETGHAVLPLLGRFRVTDYPAVRLKDTLAAEYDAQLRNQAVQILLLRRVRVTGAVARTGLYYADPTMTFGDLVALAGGATDSGKQDEIKILRQGEEIHADLSVGDPILGDLRSGDQVLVPERSWFARNSRWLIPSFLSVAVFTTVRVLTN